MLTNCRLPYDFGPIYIESLAVLKWVTLIVGLSARLISSQISPNQGGITCGTIDEPRKSSKGIDERIIIDFRDKNVVIACFRDKNGGFIDSHSDQSIAIFFYR